MYLLDRDDLGGIGRGPPVGPVVQRIGPYGGVWSGRRCGRGAAAGSTTRPPRAERRPGGPPGDLNVFSVGQDGQGRPTLSRGRSRRSRVRLRLERTGRHLERDHRPVGAGLGGVDGRMAPGKSRAAAGLRRHPRERNAPDALQHAESARGPSSTRPASATGGSTSAPATGRSTASARRWTSRCRARRWIWARWTSAAASPVRWSSLRAARSRSLTVSSTQPGLRRRGRPTPGLPAALTHGPDAHHPRHLHPEPGRHSLRRPSSPRPTGVRSPPAGHRHRAEPEPGALTSLPPS